MVRTSTDVMDINPLERMDKLSDISNEKKSTIASKKKEFEELQLKKKKEFEDLDKLKEKQINEIETKKKKELEDLDKKKKELEELEKKKTQEIAETEELIEKSFQELMRHKRQIIAQEEEQEEKKKKENQKSNLESLEEVAKTAKEFNNAQPNYSKFFENLQTPQSLYDVANRGFYANLNELRDKAARGIITSEEERFVDSLRNQFEKFENNPNTQEKDQFGYISRSRNVLDQISQYTTKR